ncbi:hypothetical protein [Salmonirosea aquatica]|uniref:Uncharacterized protein n=1 Tax=Salmonirosea aquatica TaxID=2654236 RepID=A0A7C9F8H2_9BACT|nr:hypothetical protein [Cytophagaceae bacterium SJW1-29]
MKSIIVLLGLLVWAGCDKSDIEISSEVVDTPARIVSNLAVDGCEWHFEIANADSSTITTYVPTVSSEPKVKTLVPKYGTEDAYSFIDVNIKYRLTNQKRTITCGFGHKSEVTAIEIDEIQRLE